MSFGPQRVCITHGGAANYWYDGREWCWEGAELRVFGRWPREAHCDVVWNLLIPLPDKETPNA